MIVTFTRPNGTKDEFEIFEDQVYYKKTGYYVSWANLTDEERKKKNIDLAKVTIYGIMKDQFGRCVNFDSYDYRYYMTNLDKAKTFEAREERRRKKKEQKELEAKTVKDENGMSHVVLTEKEEANKASLDFPGSESLEDLVFNDEYIGALAEMDEENKNVTEQKDDKVYQLEELPELPEAVTPDFYDFSFMNTEIPMTDIGDVEGDVVKAREDAPLKQLDTIVDKRLPGFYPIGVCMDDLIAIDSGFVRYRPVVFTNDEGEKKYVYVSYTDWKSYCDVQAIAKKHKAAA